ncbi:MAG: glycosyltransferase family 39 protein [Chloroflexi bacterium]|nr:glycosyltransferase family 39 protein [Chloroflexota bacterium]
MKPLKKPWREILNYSIIILIGIIGCYVVYMATTKGPRGWSDTTAYISSAKNLLLGNGLGYPVASGRFSPLKHYPPLYPLVIAGTGFINSNLVFNVRWLSILSFFFSLLGMSLILYKSGKSISLTATSMIVFASFPRMFAVFSSAMSEPLFLVIFIWTIYIFMQYLAKGASVYLIGSALLAGLVPLTRYVGVVVPVTILMYLFLFDKGELAARIKKSVSFAFLSGIPSLIWFAWIYFRNEHSVGGRVWNFSWAQSYADLKLFYSSFMNVIWGSLPFSEGLPGLSFMTKYLIVLIVIAIITMATLMSYKRNAKSAMSFSVFVIFGLTGLVYSILLLIIFILTLPKPDIDDRMLLPLFTSFFFYLSAAVSVWWSSAKRTTQFALAGFGLLLFSISTTAFMINDIPTYSKLKLGNTNTGYHWNNDPIIEMIRSLPDETPIISNNPDLILLWTNHPAYGIFDTLTPAFIESSLTYGEDDSIPAQIAFRNNGYLIIFNGAYGFNITFKSLYGKDKVERIKTLFAELTVVDRFDTGTIYKYNK